MKLVENLLTGIAGVALIWFALSWVFNPTAKKGKKKKD